MSYSREKGKEKEREHKSKHDSELASGAPNMNKKWKTKDMEKNFHKIERATNTIVDRINSAELYAINRKKIAEEGKEIQLQINNLRSALDQYHTELERQGTELRAKKDELDQKHVSHTLFSRVPKNLEKTDKRFKAVNDLLEKVNAANAVLNNILNHPQKRTLYLGDDMEFCKDREEALEKVNKYLGLKTATTDGQLKEHGSLTLVEEDEGPQKTKSAKIKEKEIEPTKPVAVHYIEIPNQKDESKSAKLASIVEVTTDKSGKKEIKSSIHLGSQENLANLKALCKDKKEHAWLVALYESINLLAAAEINNMPTKNMTLNMKMRPEVPPEVTKNIGIYFMHFQNIKVKPVYPTVLPRITARDAEEARRFLNSRRGLELIDEVKALVSREQQFKNSLAFIKNMPEEKKPDPEERKVKIKAKRKDVQEEIEMEDIFKPGGPTPL